MLVAFAAVSFSNWDIGLKTVPFTLVLPRIFNCGELASVVFSIAGFVFSLTLIFGFIGGRRRLINALVFVGVGFAEIVNLRNFCLLIFSLTSSWSRKGIWQAEILNSCLVIP